MRQNVSVILLTLCAFAALSGRSQAQQSPALGKAASAPGAASSPDASAQNAPAPASTTAVTRAAAFSGELVAQGWMLELAVQTANLIERTRELRGRVDPEDGGLSAKEHKIRAEAASAYDDWRRQATPTQLIAGKKLYTAWLTYADGLVACYLKCDPNDVDKGPYGLAWHQALNEFKVNTQ